MQECCPYLCPQSFQQVRSKSPSEVETIFASPLVSSTKNRIANWAAKASSTRGYRIGMGHPQLRQRPRRLTHPKIVKLSRISIGRLELGHEDRFRTNVIPRGRGYTTTFKKLPRDAPTQKAERCHRCHKADVGSFEQREIGNFTGNHGP